MSIYADPKWMKRKARIGLLNNVTLTRKLRIEGKITPEFEDMMSNLTLEDIIGLKLELSSKLIKSTFIGAPLWNNLVYICKDAVLKYAYSMANSAREASAFLGIPKWKLRLLLYRFRTENYFKTLIIQNKRKKNKDIMIAFDHNFDESSDPTR